MATKSELYARTRSNIVRSRYTPTQQQQPTNIQTPSTDIEEPITEPQPVRYAVQAYESSAAQGVIWRTKQIVDTKAEAQRLADQYSKDLGEGHRVREYKPEENLIIVKTRSERAAEENAQRIAEQNRLYRQSLEPKYQGLAVSQAEERAYQRLKDNPISYIIGSQTIKGTGKTLVMRGSLERQKAEELSIFKQKQQQKFIDPILPRLQFETAAEARAAGYQATETTILKNIEPKPSSESIKYFNKPSSKELKLTRALEKRSAEIERKEYEWFTSPIYEDINRISSKLTLGKGRPIEERSWLGRYFQGGVSSTLSIPYTLPAAAYFGGGKVAVGVLSALTQKGGKESIKTELSRSGKEVLSTTLNPLKPEGALTYTFAALGSLAKSPADYALEKASKQTPSTIIGEKYFGLKKMPVQEIKTTEIIKTPQGTTIKPSQLSTTIMQIEQPRPTLAVSRSVGSGTKTFSTTLPTGEQFTTMSLEYLGKPYYIRSKTQPTGETITNVFRQDKLLKTISTQEQPSIKFTEPLKQLDKKESISMPNLRFDVTGQLSTSKGISTIEGSNLQGAKILTQREILSVATQKQKTNLFIEPTIELETGKITSNIKSLEIFDSRYKFVDYLPEQKPLIIERAAEGIFIRKPSVSKTFQVSQLREPFIITKEGTPTIERFTQQNMNKFNLDIKKEISMAKQETPITKNEPLRTFTIAKTQTVKIQKPTTITTPSRFTYFLSDLKTKSTTLPLIIYSQDQKSSTKPTSITKLDLVSQPLFKEETILSNIQVKAPIQTPIQTPISIQTPIQTPISIQTPIQTPITELRVEQIQEPKLTQITKLKTRFQTTPQLITTPTIKPPSLIIPPFFIPSKKRLVGYNNLSSNQEGYNVYIKARLKKLKKGQYQSRGYTKANTLPLSKNAALNKLMTTLDMYSNRSGYIKKAGTSAKAGQNEALKRTLLNLKFRASKKNPNLLVEKSTFAIDSWQEKRDIPFEALKLRKAGLIKAKKKKLKSSYFKKSRMKFI